MKDKSKTKDQRKEALEHSIYLKNMAAEPRVYTQDREGHVSALMWAASNPYPMGEKK